ncbi:MAG: type-F conjugative transfer system secretin TraK [Nitrospirae bacterium]|nr:type-F conjugative transfer system secretin TraK [Nitrospirota bacterium]
MLLVATPVPAETVVIRAGAKAAPDLDAPDYIQQIKYLIRSAATGATPPGYDVSIIQDGKEACPVKECSLTVVRRLTGRNFMVTEYLLINPTKESRTYYEDLFSRPGVRAIAIEQHEVKPGGITRLFRIDEVTP